MSVNIISADTHELVTSNGSVIYQNGQILLQDKTTGDLVFVHMTEEICSMYNIPTSNENHAEDIENAVDVDEQPEGEKMWTREVILYLIHEIELADTQFENGIKKNVWMKIADDCTKQFSKKFTHKQVEAKWKSLKRTYKSILMHNKTTGKNRRTWEFFNAIHNFMHKKPEISPVATCSSSHGLNVRASEAETNQKDDSNDEPIECTNSFLKKRKMRESEASKRHKEKMTRLDRFNDLFEQMITKM